MKVTVNNTTVEVLRTTDVTITISREEALIIVDALSTSNITKYPVVQLWDNLRRMVI